MNYITPSRPEDSPSLAILVNTCDAYYDVLSLFFAAFKEHWPKCPFPVFVNTERERLTLDCASVLYSKSSKGEIRWGERLKDALAEIEADYVLMVYDDFVLEATPSIQEISRALAFLQSNAQASVVYLIDIRLPTDLTRSPPGYRRIKDREDYILNSAPGIWRKSVLNRFLEPVDNPWAWEVFGSYRTHRSGVEFYTLPDSAPDAFPYNHSKGGAIYRGLWVREVVEAKLAKYRPDIDPLVRGYYSETINTKRSLSYKVKFLALGFRMVGIKAFLAIFRYIKAKYEAASA